MKKFFFGVLIVLVMCSCNKDYDREETPGLTVYSFLPAPGQFINEGYSVSSEAEAVRYAQSRLDDDALVSLGGFGGSIVVGIGRIKASAGYDFGIVGNSFNGSSEPGIVSVMSDDNGNGLPDDEWYELAGSETDVMRGYSVTYFRPSSPLDGISWEDSLGNKGIIEHNQYHTQPYYPSWIQEESYTLSGTLLKARTEYDGTNWLNGNFGWGYADNYSSVDMILGGRTNCFRISDAVDSSGEKVALEGIDFIKVTCAVNFSNPVTGEVSTEVCGFVKL